MKIIHWTTFAPWQRWLLGLPLPLLLLAMLSVGGLWLEHRTHGVRRWLGNYLLEGNDERQMHGALWEGILASRQTRSQLQETSLPPPAALPPPLLLNRYWEDPRSSDFVILEVRRRSPPLRPEQLTAIQLQELAHSMQVYIKGKALLAHLSLAPEPFLIHARIQAQIALTDQSLFPLIYQRLRAIAAPEAWDFIRMSAEDRQYWQELIESLLAPLADENSALLGHAPLVAGVVQSLVQSWADSLLTAEIQRLQNAWESGPDFQLRIVRNMDAFIGYATTGSELSIALEFPAGQAEDLLGLASWQQAGP